MITLQDLKLMPRRTLSELLGPMFSFTLSNGPVQEREMVVDAICDTLLKDSGGARAPTPKGTKKDK